MNIKAEKIVKDVATFVKTLFDNELPEGMYFHNLDHTNNVVESVTEIGIMSGSLTTMEQTIVSLAAWFHDCGYCHTYIGHEDSSISIATNFLNEQHCDITLIVQVTACIAATKVPQRPQNLLQELLCDADMAHLAKSNYIDYANRLKQEWQIHLNKHFSEKQWRDLNLELLTQHKYFTAYGKDVLEVEKLKNIERLLNY
jgi:predicted metal-dependent HD superfamily phosphohydrolase